MKKYYMNVHYDVVIPVEIIADNEDEAMEKVTYAADTISLNDAETVGCNPCIVGTESLD